MVYFSYSSHDAAGGCFHQLRVQGPRYQHSPSRDWSPLLLWRSHRSCPYQGRNGLQSPRSFSVCDLWMTLLFSQRLLNQHLLRWRGVGWTPQALLVYLKCHKIPLPVARKIYLDDKTNICNSLITLKWSFPTNWQWQPMLALKHLKIPKSCFEKPVGRVLVKRTDCLSLNPDFTRYGFAAWGSYLKILWAQFLHNEKG